MGFCNALLILLSFMYISGDHKYFWHLRGFKSCICYCTLSCTYRVLSDTTTQQVARSSNIFSSVLAHLWITVSVQIVQLYILFSFLELFNSDVVVLNTNLALDLWLTSKKSLSGRQWKGSFEIFQHIVGLTEYYIRREEIIYLKRYIFANFIIKLVALAAVE